MSDDPRFWSFAIVSVLLVGLWAVESGRTGLLKTVWTTPDSGFSTGASYTTGTAPAAASSSSSGGNWFTDLGLGPILGALL
jgi:hypothetical protein